MEIEKVSLFYPSTGFGPEPGCSPSWLGSVGNGSTEPDDGRNGRVMAHRSSRCTAYWSSTRTACRSSPAPGFHPRAGLPAHRCHAQRASRPATVLPYRRHARPAAAGGCPRRLRSSGRFPALGRCLRRSIRRQQVRKRALKQRVAPHRCRSAARRSRVASNEGTGGG